MPLTPTTNIDDYVSLGISQGITPLQLLIKLNNLLAKRIAKSVVRELKVSKFPILSGDDSPLQNCWDEICVQVQDEHSFEWWAYEATIHSIIESHLEKEPEAYQLLLSYMGPKNNDYESITYSKSDAIDSIHEEVISIAMNYRNKKIDKYLNR
jgi:hypothetical protein